MFQPRDYLVVVPSIRPVNLKYLESLREFDIFIADDSHGEVDRGDIAREEYKDQGFSKIVLGSDSFKQAYVPGRYLHLFPNGCPSVKALGLYYAYKEGYKAVILVDDDVDTSISKPEDFMTIDRDTWAEQFQNVSGWFNTLMLLKDNKDIYARGYPYEYRGETTEIVSTNRADLEHVLPYFNEGLWVGTPDINGIDKMQMDRDYVRRSLAGGLDDGGSPWYIPLNTELSSRVHIGPGQFLPLSIMNCQIHTSLIPAFYQPPDYQLYGGWRIRRHDDIWSMFFLKLIMDQLELACTVGAPLVWHRKAGDPVTEAISEHNTNLIQRQLCELLVESADETAFYNRSNSAIWLAKTIAEVARRKLEMSSRFSVVLDDYFLRCVLWARMFMEGG